MIAHPQNKNPFGAPCKPPKGLFFVRMERPDHCPKCFSKFSDIHFLIFGEQCTDVWHKGPDYDPDRLELTPQDRTFLEALAIKPE